MTSAAAKKAADSTIDTDRLSYYEIITSESDWHLSAFINSTLLNQLIHLLLRGLKKKSERHRPSKTDLADLCLFHHS